MGEKEYLNVLVEFYIFIGSITYIYILMGTSAGVVNRKEKIICLTVLGFTSTMLFFGWLEKIFG